MDNRKTRSKPDFDAAGAVPRSYGTRQMIAIEMAEIMRREFGIDNAVVRIHDDAIAGYALEITTGTPLSADSQRALLTLDEYLHDGIARLAADNFPIEMDPQTREITGPTLSSFIALLSVLPSGEEDRTFDLAAMVDADTAPKMLLH
ncbi:MAG: hypothetical protein HYU57_07770 [Micavibrio aeruginosavorus]|nr:hypothetical protein [Micavibrio aeruginosavorus]